jgi:hypothetical protein
MGMFAVSRIRVAPVSVSMLPWCESQGHGSHGNEAVDNGSKKLV